MAKARTKEEAIAIIRIKQKIVQMLTYFMLLIATIIAGYALLPSITFTFDIRIPTLGVSVGVLIYVIIFAILGFVALRFISSALSLAGLNLDVFLTKLILTIGPSRGNPLRRIFTSILLMVFILMIHWAFRPLVELIPGIGSTLAAAFQLVVGAIVILLFWDVGRAIFRQLEMATEKIVKEVTEEAGEE